MRCRVLFLSFVLLAASAFGAFAPTDISGCVLWLKADAITSNDGDFVSSWIDSSGSNNPATQATAANQPTFRTNAIGGKPVVRFDGNDLLQTATSFANPYTIFAVGKMQGSQNQRLISSASANWLLGYWNGAMNVMYAEGWVVGSGGPPRIPPPTSTPAAAPAPTRRCATMGSSSQATPTA